jgi:hypothetical protein
MFHWINSYLKLRVEYKHIRVVRVGVSRLPNRFSVYWIYFNILVLILHSRRVLAIVRMDPGLIDPIVQYIQEEREIADVSNTWLVGNY